jgi:hypothetical protein
VVATTGFDNCEIIGVECPEFTWQRFSALERAAKLLYDDAEDVWDDNCSDDVLEHAATRMYASSAAHALRLIASTVILCAGDEEYGCTTVGDLIRRASAVAGLHLTAAEELFCHQVHTLATKGRLKSLSHEFTGYDHDMFGALYRRLSRCHNDILEKLQVRRLEAMESWS